MLQYLLGAPYEGRRQRGFDLIAAESPSFLDDPPTAWLIRPPEFLACSK
jgi:hypothetical protein